MIKAPPRLAAVRDEPAIKPIKPYEFFLLRKSAYGLSKAPRLWYVRAKELLEELNFIELELCHVTFVLEEGKQVTAIVCLHVGDGFLTTSTTRMKDLHNMISSKFNIKEWQHIGEGMSPFSE